MVKTISISGNIITIKEGTKQVIFTICVSDISKTIIGVRVDGFIESITYFVCQYPKLFNDGVDIAKEAIKEGFVYNI